jgi:uncharacterized protein (DUF488 family)
MQAGAECQRVFTIGHSTRSAADFIAVLKKFSIARVLDIRKIPGSAAHPQFRQEALERSLLEAGITYSYLPALGGRRPKSRVVDEHINAGWHVRAFHNYADYAQSDAFQDGLRQVLQLACQEPCAMMCAEVLWWRCHRRIVTDHLLARGVPVTHLFSETKSEPALLTPFAVVDARKRVSYPAQAG